MFVKEEITSKIKLQVKIVVKKYHHQKFLTLILSTFDVLSLLFVKEETSVDILTLNLSSTLFNNHQQIRILYSIKYLFKTVNLQP